MPRHCRVGYADNTTVVSTLEVSGQFPAAKADYDLMIEIGICLESRSHAPGI